MADAAAVIVLVHGDQRHLVAKPESCAALLALMRQKFPGLASISDADISFHFTPEWASVEVVLDSSSYHAVHDHAELRVEANVNPLGDGAPQAPTAEVPLSSCQRDDGGGGGGGGGGISVHITSMNGMKYSIPLPTYNVHLDYLRAAIQERTGMPPEAQRIIFSGRQLDGCATLSDFGVQNGSEMYVLCRLVGGKPAIYLLSPEPIFAACVTVELSEGWGFSALYPVVDISRPGDSNEKSKVTWNVGVDQNGYILDQHGTKYTYLYWEATNTVPPYGQLKPSEFEFTPTSPALRAEVSVVLGFPDVIPYLESTLHHLTLTTAMRQEFMAHWMPHFHKHHSNHYDIAIAFLPQKVYNEDAKLTISPQPAAVGRIFMLFAGVKTDGSLAAWDPWKGKRLTVARAIQRVDWAQKIGLDREALQDETKFRALEWGGMEVPAERASE